MKINITILCPTCFIFKLWISIQNEVILMKCNMLDKILWGGSSTMWEDWGPHQIFSANYIRNTM